DQPGCGLRISGRVNVSGYLDCFGSRQIGSEKSSTSGTAALSARPQCSRCKSLASVYASSIGHKTSCDGFTPSVSKCATTALSQLAIFALNSGVPIFASANESAVCAL